MSHAFDVAVVGGGASGALAMLHLARVTGHTLLWLPGRTRPARGIAYSTSDDLHVLNVPAGRLSAFENAPGDLVDWLRTRGLAANEASFARRREYGDYLEARLAEAWRPGARRLAREAHALRPSKRGWMLTLDDGSLVEARRVVLATGHGPPARPHGVAPDVPFPAALWEPFPELDDGTVLLVGTGLTMVDAVLVLARRPRLRFVAISRHGLLPEAHLADTTTWELERTHDQPSTARGLLRALREEVASAAAAGVDWRAVVDALRPATQALWLGLSDVERRRFLRHPRRAWDVHRHRLAPEVARRIGELRANGGLDVLAAQLVSLRRAGSGVEAVLRPRGTTVRHTMQFTAALNCTGPGIDPRRAQAPLLPRALADGLLARDPLGCGLAALADGRLLDGRGRVTNGLFALGPPLLGTLWETTAIPEIRAQAEALAARFALPRARSIHVEPAVRP